LKNKFLAVNQINKENATN